MIEGLRVIQRQKDPVLIRYRRLARPAGRREEQAYAIEGEELLRRAPRYGAELEATLWSDTFLETKRGRQCLSTLQEAAPTVPHYRLSSALLARSTTTRPLPPCVAIATRPHWSFDTIKAFSDLEAPLILAVDRGENGDNLGMLLRSAEASGVHAVLLGEGCADPYGRRVIRAARGAMFHLPIIEVPSLVETLSQLRAEGLRIYGSSAQAARYHYMAPLTEPTVLIVGNEHEGISSECLACTDEVLKIPMAGQINSLNIAVAASILLFEARRQRAGGDPV